MILELRLRGNEHHHQLNGRSKQIKDRLMLMLESMRYSKAPDLFSLFADFYHV
jgi:hypothetical protein